MTLGNPLLAILGPTASGKTRLSLHLAEQFNGEIISADSRLIYRGLDIGTAKPSRKVRERISHHLIDVADPEESWSLARYQKTVYTAIEGIFSREGLPILAGGTGQYVTAILEGWTPPPRSKDDNLRREFETYAQTHSTEALHQRLHAIDPVAAERIDHRNVRRVVRALEIYHVTGELPSRQRKSEPVPYNAHKVGLTLPRKELYARIDQRIEQMIEGGWMEEVQGLVNKGIKADDPGMNAIGYPQILAHLEGEMSLDEAVREIRALTRQLVRRQANWFKLDDESIRWFEDEPGVEEKVALSVRDWLSSLEQG